MRKIDELGFFQFSEQKVSQMIYYGENANIFAYPTSPGPCFIISFSNIPYFLLKMIGKIVKISSFASGQNWQQNFGRLTSDDDSY